MKNNDNLSSSSITEKYEDLVFSRVMALYMEEEFEREKSSFEKAENSSAVKKLYGKFECRENLKTLWGVSKKALRFAAMFVFIAVISISTSMAAFAGVRETVTAALYHLITDEQEIYTEVSIGESTGFIDPEIYDWEGAYAPTYLPEGFEYFNRTNTGVEVITVYFSGTDTLVFSQGSEDFTVRADIDKDLIKESVRIGESEGFIVENNTKLVIFWNIGSTFFRLEGRISQQELLFIAENIKALR